MIFYRQAIPINFDIRLVMGSIASSASVPLGIPAGKSPCIQIQRGIEHIPGAVQPNIQTIRLDRRADDRLIFRVGPVAVVIHNDFGFLRRVRSFGRREPVCRPGVRQDRRRAAAVRRVLPADGAVPVRRVLRAGGRADTDRFIRAIAVPLRGGAHTVRRVLPANGAVSVRRVLRTGGRAGADGFIRVIAVLIRGGAHAIRRVLPADGAVLIRRVRIAARGTGANRLALRLREFFRQHRKSDG